MSASMPELVAAMAGKDQKAKLEAVQALHAKLTAGDPNRAARKQPPKRDVLEALVPLLTSNNAKVAEKAGQCLGLLVKGAKALARGCLDDALPFLVDRLGDNKGR